MLAKGKPSGCHQADKPGRHRNRAEGDENIDGIAANVTTRMAFQQNRHLRRNHALLAEQIGINQDFHLYS